MSLQFPTLQSLNKSNPLRAIQTLLARDMKVEIPLSSVIQEVNVLRLCTQRYKWTIVEQSTLQCFNLPEQEVFNFKINDERTFIPVEEALPYFQTFSKPLGKV